MRAFARFAVLAALIGAARGAALASPAPGAERAADTIWEPLKVGAGGFVTGIDVDLSGTTYVIRTDTYGAYVGDGSGAWRQLLRADAMPAAFTEGFTEGTTQSLGAGVFEIRVAPSDPNRLYMVLRNEVYRSADRGASWADTSFPDAGKMDANGPHRHWGERMAVDPANPDVVYVGSVTSGLYVTTGGGARWARVPPGSVPVGDARGITGIAFDPSGGTTGGRTSRIYLCSNGNGVYRSTDAGATWALLAGGPTSCSHAAVATDGVYYVVNRTRTLHRYAAGTWSTSTADTTLHSIATDPFDAARIVGGRESGNLLVSADRGATWGGTIWSVKRVATDVPWLAWASETYMTNGAMRFDPVVANKLWFAQGIGVWYTRDPTARPTAWTSHSAGIEQLVARDVCVPPGSPSVVAAGMDRSVFVLPRANASFPSRYVTLGLAAPLIPAWAVAYSATNPRHLVAVVNQKEHASGYSLDGGATWTRFPVQPAAGTSGDVVAPSIDEVVVVIGTRYAYRSTDRGRSWTKLALPGDGGADSRDLHCGYNCKKHVLAVDGADASTIYLYFHTRGLYRSTDRGATWALVSSERFDGANMYWHAKLRSVPGRAGHLFLTGGHAGGSRNPNPQRGTHLWRSRDGGVTWTRVAGVAEPYDVALGKAAPGASYPAIYVVGWLEGAYGIWRSIDDAATWTRIGQFPFGSVDEINVITASQDAYGEVWVAFQGSGWGHGRLRAPPQAEAPAGPGR